MLYIIFLISSTISLGMGVWLAMCHAESLRHSDRVTGDVASAMGEVASDFQPDTSHPELETRSSTQRVDQPTPAITKQLIFGEMTEQLVAMIQDDDSDEFSFIVEQLQEIHDMTTTADESCYVSEDADSFLTPDEEQYATTAICRPRVGKK